MKKVLFILFNLLTITVMAQTKGRFEVHDLGNYKLHVYYTHDALGDASYIVEGKNGLVTMEQPLFKDNVAEFDTYLASGAELFIGGHGGAAKRDAVEFKIDYLKKMKELLGANNTAQDFVDGMKRAYPGLPGGANLPDLGKALYK